MNRIVFVQLLEGFIDGDIPFIDFVRRAGVEAEVDIKSTDGALVFDFGQTRSGKIAVEVHVLPTGEPPDEREDSP